MNQSDSFNTTLQITDAHCLWDRTPVKVSSQIPEMPNEAKSQVASPLGYHLSKGKQNNSCRMQSRQHLVSPMVEEATTGIHSGGLAFDENDAVIDSSRSTDNDMQADDQPNAIAAMLQLFGPGVRNETQLFNNPYYRETSIVATETGCSHFEEPLLGHAFLGEANALHKEGLETKDRKFVPASGQSYNEYTCTLSYLGRHIVDAEDIAPPDLNHSDGPVSLPSCNPLFYQTFLLNQNYYMAMGVQPMYIPVAVPILSNSLKDVAIERQKTNTMQDEPVQVKMDLSLIAPARRTLTCSDSETRQESFPGQKALERDSSIDECDAKAFLDKSMSMKYLEEAALHILRGKAHEDTNKEGGRTKRKLEYQCRVCEQTFTRKFSRDAHECIHTGARPFRCSECGLSFRQTGTLAIHTRAIHKKLRPHTCPHCQKSFGHLSGLKTHIRVHTKEKPYRCQVCDRRFSDPGTFSKHKRVHTDERPYQCLVCDRTFSQSANAARHAKNVHKNELKDSKDLTRREKCDSALSQNFNKANTGMEKEFSGERALTEPTKSMEITCSPRLRRGSHANYLEIDCINFDQAALEV